MRYLDSVRAPCTRLPDTTIDPCARREQWWFRLYPQSSSGYIARPDLPINVESLIRRMWSRGNAVFTPQIVIRGTVLPGSARCVESRAVHHGEDFFRIYGPDSKYVQEVCFVDVSVGEYIVGKGPTKLPIVVGWRNSVPTDEPGYGTDSYYGAIAAPIKDWTEEIEFVFMLTRPVDRAWADWGIGDIWDVQRTSDGSIIASHELAGIFATDTDSSDFEYPLVDLRRMIRDAHAKVSREFNGRVGDSPDSPKLVTDANREFLLEQLRELGAYDIPGITPMAAPAFAEPYAPTDLYGELWTAPQPEVHLAWTAPVGSQVTTYKIKRVDNLGNEVVVAEIPAEFVKVTDRHLPIAGAEYTYTVIAVNEHGESVPSAPYVLRVP